MRRDDFSPRSHRAVSLQNLLSSETAKAEATVAIVYPVEPYGKWMSLSSSDSSWSLIMISMKKTLFSLSAALPYDPFHSKEISDVGIMNEYFVRIDFQTTLGFATIKFNKICVSIFISLQCCYPQWHCYCCYSKFSWQMGDFRKPSLGFALITQQDISQLREGLELYYKWCELVSSVGRALHRYHRGHGFKSHTGLDFL